MIFTSLIAKDAPSSSSSSSACHPPTAVQFYSSSDNNLYIDFRTLSTSTAEGGGGGDDTPAIAVPPPSPRRGYHHQKGEAASGGSIRPYANLSYHAARVPPSSSGADDDEEEEMATMGVWNVRTTTTTTTGDDRLTELLLDRVILPISNSKAENSVGEEKKAEEEEAAAADETAAKGQSKTCSFVITIDMDEPSGVAPALTSVVSAVVNHFDKSTATPPQDDGGDEASTTYINDLRNYEFGGVPPPYQEGDVEEVVSEKKDGKKIALVLACVVPSRQPATYRDKQAQALVTYHLHRFAHAVNCTLAFVRRGRGDDDVDQADDDDEGGGNASAAAEHAVDVSTLCSYIYRASRGLPPAAAEEAEGTVPPIRERTRWKGREEEDAPPAVRHSFDLALVPPNHHDRTVIETTLRRNAGCDGRWDAEKDSLAVALPSPVLPPAQDDGGKKAAGGESWDDEAWMERLAGSVKVSEVKAPQQPAAAGGAAASAVPSKKQGEPSGKKKAAAAAASDATSFFENLLKK